MSPIPRRRRFLRARNLAGVRSGTLAFNSAAKAGILEVVARREGPALAAQDDDAHVGVGGPGGGPLRALPHYLSSAWPVSSEMLRLDSRTFLNVLMACSSSTSDQAENASFTCSIEHVHSFTVNLPHRRA